MTASAPAYHRVQWRPKAAFDRRTFRVVPFGDHRVIVGNLKSGETAPVAQAVLHPVERPSPCQRCERSRDFRGA